MIDVFTHQTGWRPAHALPVAGALPYSRYNFVIRLVMKRIARKAGGPTDTSHDYEFTDWLGVDRFVIDVIGKPARVAASDEHPPLSLSDAATGTSNAPTSSRATTVKPLPGGGATSNCVRPGVPA